MKSWLKVFGFLLVFALQINLNAQLLDDDSSEKMDEIIVTGFIPESIAKTSLNVTSLSVPANQLKGHFTLAELMAKTPGISLLSTGIGIAKPVIRGASGNRVLILLNGLKFDNQQWQEEHGLGLGDLGVGKVEIVKGPMSVLFGSEALSGVINILDEGKPSQPGMNSFVSSKFNSNTLGLSLQYGFEKMDQSGWSRLRFGAEQHADYSDGLGNRVLNSRFDGYALKYARGKFRTGLKKPWKWRVENTFSSSLNRFGFIFNDVYTFIKPDSRWSRSFSLNPCHIVLFNIFSSQHQIEFDSKTLLSVNAGIQSNERMENEGGGQISLNMHLLTLQYLAKLLKKLKGNRQFFLSNMLVLENNMNFGGRKIVPNANMAETNFSGYYESKLGKLVTTELGLGLGYKFIKTFVTETVNSSEKEIGPFTKQSPYFNLFTGASIQIERLNFKVNISTGVRVPNLAELSSNGLHEGINTYEVGNPNFKNERLIALNSQLNFNHTKFKFSFSPFLNKYSNYIYLAPSDEKWMGLYPKWYYKQQDATQYGAEIAISAVIHRAWQISLAGSMMDSKTADGKYTPYIPSNKLSPGISYEIYFSKTKLYMEIGVSADFVKAQTKLFSASSKATSFVEIGSANYNLLNSNVTFKWNRTKHNVHLSLSGNNLTNQQYFDNLSRFKNYGLYNIGRNIAFALKYTF